MILDLRKYALRVVKLVKALPNTTEGRVMGNQLFRSGTSVGANYRAACRARSVAEFIAKIGTVIEEIDESAFWLELIIESELMPKKLVDPLLKETNELTAIMVTSRKTSASNAKINRQSEICSHK
ncbi:MAG: four helix bundle protein [Dehalococcoidia bacterium]